MISKNKTNRKIRKTQQSKERVNLSVDTVEMLSKLKVIEIIIANKVKTVSLKHLTSYEMEDVCAIINSRSKGQRKNTALKDYLLVLRIVRNRYDNLQDRDKNAFEKNFDSFVKWWFSNQHGNKKIGKKAALKGLSKQCYYCGITENDLCNIFNNPTRFKKINESYLSGTYHESKAGNKWNSPTLEIDKLDPNKGYNNQNCVFACHLCNNAKTDIIEAQDFIDTIAIGIKEYYKTIGKS